MDVELNCMVCGTKYIGEEPKMCCNGSDCGCMGMPTEPLVCSQECYDTLMNPVPNKLDARGRGK